MDEDELSYKQETRIVLIGTSTCPYDEKNLPPIPHIINNIAELTRLFTDPEVIGLEKATAIVTILDEEEASAVLDKVVNAAKAATDTLLVYYAGHGLYGDATQPLYLVAKNSTSENKAFNAIPVNTLRRAIAVSPATKRIWILDCCYSGNAFEGGMGPEDTAHQSIDIAGTYGVAAVPANEKALAPPGERLTAFTKELVDIVDKGISHKGKVLTLDDVFEEIRSRLNRAANMPVPQASNWRDGRRFRFARNRFSSIQPPTVIRHPLIEQSQPVTNSVGMEFVLIRAGEFFMGSAHGSQSERPVHRVKISRPFYLSKYEVTQGQWESVMGSNPSHFRDDANRPVEMVSWQDAQKFILQLNYDENTTDYRLPTEAEWEYAARAASRTNYCFGDDRRQLENYAWFNSDETHAVGKLKPNDWGLYDMHGNLWEWVQDWYGAYSMETITDPLGPPTGSTRVVRGGDWYCEADSCHSAVRHGFRPDSRLATLGFRLVKEAS